MFCGEGGGMKRIGLIGGIGPESTVDYYERIVAATAAGGPGAQPEVVIFGANLAELTALMETGDHDRLVEWLVAKLDALAAAGAELGAITANTPHLVFDRVKARSPLPLRSIVEATRDEALRQGARRLALLGTRFTMAADFYARCFAPAGLQVVVPDAAGQELIHRRLMTEIELGVFKDSTRAELLGIVESIHRATPVDAVILGCTELPLILDRERYDVGGPRPLPFLNTTAIHVADLLRAAA
jgi:aspartate racemase